MSAPNFLWRRSQENLRVPYLRSIIVSSVFSGHNHSYNILTSGVNLRTAQKLCLSTLSPAHQMKGNKISSSWLRTLSLKPHNFLCYHSILSNRNQYLLSCSTYFLTDTTKRCHFSQPSCRQFRAIATGNIFSLSDIVSKEPSFLNPLSSYSIVHWRRLRGFPSNRADKQSQDKVSGKNTETTTDKVNVDTGLRTDGPVTETGSSEVPKQLTLYQRFKKTYKEHGKVLVAVHLLTSAVWIGSFYALVRCGFDIVPYLESWNFSERIISPFRSGGLGDFALVYLIYKLASPARYTVTIAGTNLAIRYFRKVGKIPQVPVENSIRSLYREGKENIKRKSTARFKKLRKRNKSKQNGQKDKF